VHFPTFWADDARLSFLIPPEACRRLLHASGFQELVWHDTTAQAVEQSRTRLAAGAEEAPSDDSPPALGLGVIIATDLDVRSANMLRNFTEGRLAKLMAVFERPV